MRQMSAHRKEEKRHCHVAKANWNLSDAKKTCASDAHSFTVASGSVYMLLSQSKLATCVHFISFYL